MSEVEKKRGQIYRHWKRNPDMTQQQLADHYGVSRHVVADAITIGLRRSTAIPSHLQARTARERRVEAESRHTTGVRTGTRH